MDPILADGAPAPSFALTDQHGIVHRLEDYAGRWLVLYFSPRDEVRPCCPVAAAGQACAPCTQEPIEFGAASERLDQLGAVVVGLHRNGGEWIAALTAEHPLPPLAINADLGVSEAYGGWREREIRGVVTPSMTHSTVIVAPDGRVARTWPKYMTEGHVAEVLGALQELRT